MWTRSFFVFVAAAAATSLDADVTEGSLAAEDACTSGQDCGLSMLQLRRRAATGAQVLSAQQLRLSIASGHASMKGTKDTNGTNSTIEYTYGVGYCYEVGDFAIQYTCDNNTFAQLTYSSTNCSGDPAVTMGGLSPWTFETSLWTCESGIEACVSSWKVENATTCVHAQRVAVEAAAETTEAGNATSGKASSAPLEAAATENASSGNAMMEAAAADAGNATGGDASLLQMQQFAAEQLRILVARGHLTNRTGDAASYTYGLGHCYSAGRFAVQYSCDGNTFTQLGFSNSACTGPPMSTLGGASPWSLGPGLAVWTCKFEMKACEDAFQVHGASACVQAARPTVAPATLPATLAPKLLEVSSAAESRVSSAAGSEARTIAQSLRKELMRFSDNHPMTYALDHCYLVSFDANFSTKYTCEDGTFAQLTYDNHDCSGLPSVTVGGPSPWRIAQTVVWTCTTGADKCTDAKDVTGATLCVKSTIEVPASESEPEE